MSRAVSACAALCFALTGCGGTLDSLGGSPPGGAADGGSGALAHVSGPASYPNVFRDLLGKSDADINAKLAAAFAQLFHGDPAMQSIYVQVGTDQAYIHDVYHDDVRTEGNGLAMIIAVELNKRDELDRLWTYAKAVQRVTTGPGRGYFNSVCDETTPCLDPFGMEQFATALIFANDRWGGDAYAQDASALLDLLVNKERENGGVVAGVTSAFDPATALVREQPTSATAGYTRAALQIPAMYELWARASGDSFWTQAAVASRANSVAAASTSTGLTPQANYFDGTTVPSEPQYGPQGYRASLNLALDAAWGSVTPGEIAVADHLLGFFTAQGLSTYGKAFQTDGTVVDIAHEQGLVAVNGALAVASTRSNRADFASAVWAMPIPSADARYYDGLLYLTSLLVLSGQYRIY